LIYLESVAIIVKNGFDWFYYFFALPVLVSLPRRLRRKFYRALAEQRFLRECASVNEIRRSLQQVFTESTPSQSDNVIKGVFDTRIREDACAFRYPFWNSGNVEKHFEFCGLNHVDTALKQGNGAIILSSHFGVCSGLVALGIKGYPVNYIGHNAPEDPAFRTVVQRHSRFKINRIERSGQRFIIFDLGDSPNRSYPAVKKVLNILHQNQLVVIMLDVSPQLTSRNAPARFLGFDAKFPAGFLQIAKLADCPIIPQHTLKDKGAGGRHQVELFQPIEVKDDSTEGLQPFVDRLSDLVKHYPSQWLSWEWFTHFLR